MGPVVLCLTLIGCGAGETKTVTVTETVTVTAPATDTSTSTTSASVGDAAKPGTRQEYRSPAGLTLDGKPVDVNLQVRVAKIRGRVANPQYLEPQSGNRYVRATVTIRNTGEQAFTPSADFQALTTAGDSSGFQSLGQPGDLGPAAVRPGKTVRGRVWAEIPKKSRLDEVIFAPFGGDPDSDLVWNAR